MAKFEPKKAVITKLPTVTVDANLPPGKYQFQLVVENERGQQSRPDTIVIVVEKRG